MLCVKNLKKVYPKSDRVAVDGISFELKPGEIFGFLGQNGAGKSTTIKCLTGILPFDSGSIEICGYDIAKDPINAKMNMGYVPDNHSVYEKLTGREYVNYVADLYKVSKEDREKRLNKYLELFKLSFAIDKQIKAYSHGMKQKICIIAALIHEPKLWVLDEPMMGLDPQSTAEIVAYMKEHCAKGNTVFFSSHNLDLVKRLCDRVAIINEGHLIDCFTLAGHEENKANLEERFFRITNTYDKRIFDDYVAQEAADMRPKAAAFKETNPEPTASAEKESSAPVSEARGKKPEKARAKADGAEDMKKRSEA
jgi:ABC-2 type transport system ATP-binding protein